MSISSQFHKPHLLCPPKGCYLSCFRRRETSRHLAYGESSPNVYREHINHIMYWYVSWPCRTLMTYDLWPSGGSLLLHFSDQSTGVQRVQESWNMLEEFNKSLQDHGSFQVSAIISCLVSGAGENHWCSTRPSPEKVMDSGKIPYLKTCILWRGNQNKIGTHQ